MELTCLCGTVAEKTHSHGELANVSGMRNWSSIGLLLARIRYSPLFSTFAALFELACIKSYFKEERKIGKNEPSKAGRERGWRLLCMPPTPRSCFSLPMKMNILVGVRGRRTEVTLSAALLPKETVLGELLFLP